MLPGQEQGLKDLCSVTNLVVGGKEGVSSTFVVDGVTFFIPLEGVVDIDAEITRLNKKLEQVKKVSVVWKVDSVTRSMERMLQQNRSRNERCTHC